MVDVGRLNDHLRIACEILALCVGREATIAEVEVVLAVDLGSNEGDLQGEAIAEVLRHPEIEPFGAEVPVVVRGHPGEVTRHRHEADREIAGLAREWPPHRQPVVDRNLLRMGWYELRHTSAPAPKVVSDAVELAKEFGAAESGKFVNGVLDRVMHAGAGGAGGG